MAGRYSTAGAGTGAAADGPGGLPGRSAGAVGDVVAGVRLEDLVGEGASGRVWAGTDVDTGERVAVKLLRTAGAEREAALLAGLRHPHVLPLRRVGTDPPAVVTDLAGGGSLAAQVRARGSLRPAEVVTVVAPLAAALQTLHGQGVVHGDVSASNVLFVDRGRPVLADLGGAVLAGAGRAVATAGYVAPEVLAGAPPGPAADVHGLAGCAWLALTGQPPPPAQDRLPLRLLVPACPDELVAAVTAGLDPDPAARPEPAALAAAARASCPSEPVRLVPSAALGIRAEEAITYRVRAAAREAGREPTGGRRRLLRRSGLRLPGRRPVREAVRSRPLLLAGSAATVLAALAASVLLLGPPGEGSDGAGSSRAAPAGTEVSTASGTVASAPFDLSGGGDGLTAPAPPGPSPSPPAAAGDGLEQQVVALVAARERALRAGDASALALVHHPEGGTLAADTALLEDGGVDVRHEVLEVVPTAEGTARVTLRTELAGAPAVTEQVTVVLARHAGRWRVHDVTV